MTKRIFCALALFIGVVFGVEGKVRLPAIISDNMVLQQKSDVKIWGWADAGAEVSVTETWSGKVYSATADEQGRWSLYIKTPGCKSGQSLVISSGGDSVTVGNILVGEVWLASGQSNMEFEMKPHPVDKWMTGMYEWEMPSSGKACKTLSTTCKNWR